jgi:exopolyphosphatase/pppGpp-phosphohydrolase
MIENIVKVETNDANSVARDEKLNAVLHLAETCEYEVEHTQQVTRLALDLFDELAVLHHLGSRERNWLQYASLLHDIGWIEGQKGHHKAALRIILTTPLLPFENKERIIIGSIARYHRKALPSLKHDHFATLKPEEQRIVEILAACLRMADGLDCLHQNRVVDLKCKVTKKSINMICFVQKMIPNEVSISMEKADLIELVFQRKLMLVYKKSHHG